jgi:hypothetical protein
MDVKTLIQSNKARFNLNSQKEQLKEKYQSKLIFAEQGGLWKADSTLFSLLSLNQMKECVLLDIYENPIKVQREDLLNRANQVYNDTMNLWHQEFEELRSKR